MTPGSSTAAACSACGSPLHADQRYCLRCGARHGAPRVDPLEALGFPLAAVAEPASAPEEAPAAPAGARRVPSRRVAAGLAAATLALGVVAGAALGPGPSPSVAAAPQRLVALVVPSAAPPPATTTQDPPTEPEDDGSSDTPSASEDDPSSDDAASASDDSSSTTDDTTDTSAGDTDDTPADDDTTTTPAASDDDASSTSPSSTTTPAATVPAHVFLISLTGLDATAFAPASPLADLVAQGTLLSNYTAAAPSAAANEIALLGGQVPTADCNADLAACVLPAGETSLPDQLATDALTWHAYVADPAQRCAPTPSARVAVSLFTTLASRKDCASNVVDPATLDADLAKKTKTPALSLFVPAPPEDGSAGLDAVSAPLHALVAKITASAAYKADGILVVTSDAQAPGAAPGPLGALVLSPRATAARTVDAATGPVALLRSLEDLFGLDPLGAAAQVTAPALDGVLAPPVATASAASIFPHPSHPTNTTRRST